MAAVAHKGSPQKYTSSLKVGPGTLVCSEAEIVGDVTIGARSIVHPKAQIIAEAGPIIIGESNLIEEQAVIINRFPEGVEKSTQTVMIIGNHNVFEVGSHSEALKIGEHNVIEAKARVGRQTELTNGCIIGAMCSVASNEVLQENTVIFSSDCERRIQQDKPPPQTLQLDFLTKIIPNYHYLMKSQKLGAK
ncbi:dynactin subunit 6-like [Liolophura sinensis]|uniref:dynactin subunit 6-like n=1 Tax=Liolophura sinensis TaxID=3198878 RepID=UPI003157FC96